MTSDVTERSRINTAEAIKSVLEPLVYQLHQSGEQVSVRYELGEETILFFISSTKIGVVLGKNGKTISCLRHLVDAIASKNNHRAIIQTVY